MKFEGEARIKDTIAKRPRIEGKAQTDGEGQSPSSEALTAGKGRRPRSPSESTTAGVTRPSVSPGQRRVSQLVVYIYKHVLMAQWLACQAEDRKVPGSGIQTAFKFLKHTKEKQNKDIFKKSNKHFSEHGGKVCAR